MLKALKHDLLKSATNGDKGGGMAYAIASIALCLLAYGMLRCGEREYLRVFEKALIDPAYGPPMITHPIER